MGEKVRSADEENSQKIIQNTCNRIMQRIILTENLQKYYLNLQGIFSILLHFFLYFF